MTVWEDNMRQHGKTGQGIGKALPDLPEPGPVARKQLARLERRAANRRRKKAMDLGTKMIEIKKIRTDGGTQPRAEIDQTVVEDYRDAMQNGSTFPPVDLYYDGSDYWLADGYHRKLAAEELYELIEAHVHMGTRRDAVLHSVGANARHGLRRSNEDKRRAIETVLRDEEWVQNANTWIAEKCGVTDKTVAKVRAELEASSEIPKVTERRYERDGQVVIVDTTTLGQNQPEANEPEVAFEVGDRVAHAATGEIGTVKKIISAPIPGTNKQQQTFVSITWDGDPDPHDRRSGGKLKHALLRPEDVRKVEAVEYAEDDEPEAEAEALRASRAPVSPAEPASKPTPAPAPKPEIPGWLVDYRKLLDETDSVVLFAVGEGQHVLVAFEQSAVRIAHALRQVVIGTRVGPDLVSCIKVHELHEPTMDRLHDMFGAGLMIVTEDVDPKLKQFVDTRITTTAEYQPPMDEATKQAAVRERMGGIFPGQSAQPSADADGSSPPPWVTGDDTAASNKPTFTVVGPFAMAMQRTTRFLGHALQAVADAEEETTEEREHAIAHYMRGVVENNVQAVYDILSRVSEPKNLKALGDLIENRDEGRSADAVIRDWLWAKKQEADKPAEPEVLDLKVQGEEDDAA